MPSRRFISPMKRATKPVCRRLYRALGAPACCSRPRSSTATRSAMARASSWSWVTNTVVNPKRCKTLSSRRISSRRWRSRLARAHPGGAGPAERRSPGPGRRAAAGRRTAHAGSSPMPARRTRFRAQSTARLRSSEGTPASVARRRRSGPPSCGGKGVVLEHHPHVALVGRDVVDDGAPGQRPQHQGARSHR